MAEGFPHYEGHAMAKKLSEAGIHTTLIADSAVFAMMARANKASLLIGSWGGMGSAGHRRKGFGYPSHTISPSSQVLVGAHAVLANGGIICPSGINMVALAARKHSVPFVVLVGLHKLSPLFPHDPDLAYNGGP